MIDSQKCCETGNSGLAAVAVLGVGGVGGRGERVLFGVARAGVGAAGGLRPHRGVPSRRVPGGGAHC